MSISFPNPSRSYDSANSRVRFWGHDRAMEVAFLLEEDTLLRMSPQTPSTEEGILSAFDANRRRIDEAAAQTYADAGHRSHTHILSMKDFFKF